MRQVFQPCPVEAWAGVLFSAGRNVFVPCHMRDGVVAAQVLTKISQAAVLGVFKEIAFKAFEFNADRVVIAVGPPSVLGLPCMPGAVIAADKLPKRAIAADVKVR